MGYTGDFQTKKEAFLYAVNSFKWEKDLSKIEPFNFQDIVLTRKDGKKIFIVCNYYCDAGGDWRVRIMDHSEGPCADQKISKEAFTEFLKNPAGADGEFAKPWIAEQKKKILGRRMKIKTTPENDGITVTTISF